VAHDLQTFQRTEKIQLKSKKQYSLTTNKLDVSIFQFKDRPIFKKREPSPPPPNSQGVLSSIARESQDRGGFGDSIRQTKPAKRELAKVQETDFTVDDSAIMQARQEGGDGSQGSLGRQSVSGVDAIKHSETPANSTMQPKDAMSQSLKNSKEAA
jgi:hypothetical protein